MKRPEKKREPAAVTPNRMLPMELQIGDRLADETGEWEIIGRPYTPTAPGRMLTRVHKVGQPDVTRCGRGARTSALA